MKQDVAVELLKIAAKLTEIAVTGKAKTASQKAASPPVIESAFQDCLKAVESHFARLIGGAE